MSGIGIVGGFSLFSFSRRGANTLPPFHSSGEKINSGYALSLSLLETRRRFLGFVQVFTRFECRARFSKVFVLCVWQVGAPLQSCSRPGGISIASPGPRSLSLRNCLTNHVGSLAVQSPKDEGEPAEGATSRGFGLYALAVR